MTTIPVGWLTGLLSSNQRSNSKANTRTKFTGFARVRYCPVRSATGGSFKYTQRLPVRPKMFAMTSLVGTPVVAAPKATRAVRSTKTVAAFGAKKAPAKKAPAKKVRTLTNFQRTYLDPLPSTAARSRTGGPERARRAHRRPVTFVEARIGRRSHRRAGNSARHVAAEGGVFRIKSRALPSLSEPTGRKT